MFRKALMAGDKVKVEYEALYVQNYGSGDLVQVQVKLPSGIHESFHAPKEAVKPLE